MGRLSEWPANGQRPPVGTAPTSRWTLAVRPYIRLQTAVNVSDPGPRASRN